MPNRVQEATASSPARGNDPRKTFYLKQRAGQNPPESTANVQLKIRTRQDLHNITIPPSSAPAAQPPVGYGSVGRGWRWLGLALTLVCVRRAASAGGGSGGGSGGG
jgi:hypothetical protein